MKEKKRAKKKLRVKIEIIPLQEEKWGELLSCSTSYGCHGSGNACHK